MFVVLGTRLVILKNDSNPLRQKAALTSPLYQRSQQEVSLCLKFRYLLIGRAQHMLRVYQQLVMEGGTRRLMWKVTSEPHVTNNTMWKYARVTLPSVTKYQVSFTSSSLLTKYANISWTVHQVLFPANPVLILVGGQIEH